MLDRVVAEMRRLFNIDSSVEVVLECNYPMPMSETLNNLNVTLDDAGIFSGQRLVIREKKPVNSSGSRQPRLDYYCKLR